MWECPDGSVYAVADTDACKDLSAEGGGKMLSCHQSNGPWSQMQVKCGAAGGWGKTMPELCVNSPAAHALQILAAAFEVTHLKPMGSGNGDSSTMEMKKIKLVTFPQPPRITNKKLEAKEFEQRSFEAFEPQKELGEFDLSTVQNWFPFTPGYKPSCALRGPEVWKSLADIAAADASGWGVDARNKVDIINLPENLARIYYDVTPPTSILDASHRWNPCLRYFWSDSRVNAPVFETNFRLSNFLSFDNLKAARDVARETYDVKGPTDVQLKPAGDIAAYYSMVFNPVGNKVNTEKILWGLTPQALEECKRRKIIRYYTVEEMKKTIAFRQRIADGAYGVADRICGIVPSTGTVLAPFGFGP